MKNLTEIMEKEEKKEKKLNKSNLKVLIYLAYKFNEDTMTHHREKLLITFRS